MANNPALKEILFIEDSNSRISTSILIEYSDGDVAELEDVKIVSLSEDRQLLKVDQFYEKEQKLASRYFNMKFVRNFSFDFIKKEDI